jgi:hypothetical protein
MNGLKEALSRRHDSYWELLATAAGASASTAKTIEGISAREIYKGVQGRAIAPSFIRERIEAISVSNVQILADLARQWIDPQDIHGDPWWIAAWEASLRHLKGLRLVTQEAVNVPELSREVHVLWNDPIHQQVSWHTMLHQARLTEIQNFEIRDKSRYQLEERSISGPDVRQAPPKLFRLLRGRANRLDPSARAILASMQETCLNRDPFEAALIIELYKELSLGTCENLYYKLADLVPSMTDPRDIIPLVYVLLNDNWKVP